VELWALLPRPAAARIAVQRAHAGHWTTLLHVSANRHGMLDAIIPLRGRANLRLALSTNAHSGPWRALPR
jgi:hypothetical protein